MRHSLRILFMMVLALTLLPLNFSSQSINAQEDDIPEVFIGAIQGEVTDDLANANELRSEFRGEQVQISGVVTNIQMIDSSGRKVYAFFLQERPENSDGNPNTSDAIQVITGARNGFDDYDVVIGDEITLVGEVEEYYDLTRLRQPEFVSLDGQVENLDEAVPPIELNPQGEPADVYRYYERIENMRVFVPAGAVVVSPTHLFSSSNDTEAYIVRPDHPIAQRDNLFARRVFRDIHPMDEGEVSENLYRISIEGNILKAQEDDYDVNLPIYNTFDVFTTELSGNIIYAFGRYTLQIDQFPEVEAAGLPYENDELQELVRTDQFSVATINVENLYDFVDDPFDRQDNPDDTRLNYVPFTISDYETHVYKVALQIIYLGMPDVVGFQEMEDQDVCIGGGNLFGVCLESVNNADGAPDVLQDVTSLIYYLTGEEVDYIATTDRDSADDRGISQGFIYRADRVELVEPTADHPIFGTRTDDAEAEFNVQNTEVSNPKALNARFGPGVNVFDRAPLVGLFRIHREAVGSDDFVDVYYANNHFKSNPNENIGLREQQSSWNLQLMEAVLAVDPDAYFVIGGDLNSFRESSEIALIDEVLVNAMDYIPEESQYTYIFAGQTQTLDYLFFSDSLDQLIDDAYIVHIASDYSYQYETEANSFLRAGDHDPVIAHFNFPE